jgi:hypothetical protein
MTQTAPDCAAVIHRATATTEGKFQNGRHGLQPSVSFAAHMFGHVLQASVQGI